jgi:hypothetical protein
MANKPKKAERKIEDLQVDETTGAEVKGGQAAIPTRASIYRRINNIFRPKS